MKKSFITSGPDQIHRHSVSVVERPLCDREDVGSIPLQRRHNRDFKNGISFYFAWRSAFRK